MLQQLVPYLQHIGNCGAVGGAPTDDRCICGLRRTYIYFEAWQSRAIAVVRYILRVRDYGTNQRLGKDNLDAAIYEAEKL